MLQARNDFFNPKWNPINGPINGSIYNPATNAIAAAKKQAANRAEIELFIKENPGHLAEYMTDAQVDYHPQAYLMKI